MRMIDEHEPGGGPLPQRVCDPTHEDRLVERYAPQNGPKSGHEPAHLTLRGTRRHYVAQECPLHLVVPPRYPSRAPRACVVRRLGGR